MTPTECVDLVEFIADRCPAMKIREHTADTWYVDLVEYDLPDALEAARRASHGEDFVSLARLLRECDHVRAQRIGRERVAELEAQIAAENPPLELHDRPVAALDLGQQVPKARILAQSVAASRKPAAALDTTAVAADQQRRAQAHAELEQARAAHATASGQATPDETT